MTRVDQNVTFNTDFFAPTQLTVSPVQVMAFQQQPGQQAVYAEAVPMNMNPSYNGEKLFFASTS